MEYREIEALSLDEAKFRIKKEYGDRARIIKIVETYSGGFLGIGKKKKVKVLISISDIDLLKKYKENMRINDVYSKNNEKNNLVPNNITDEITMSVLLEKLNRIESEIQKGKVEDDNNLHENLLEIREILKGIYTIQQVSANVSKVILGRYLSRRNRLVNFTPPTTIYLHTYDNDIQFGKNDTLDVLSGATAKTALTSSTLVVDLVNEKITVDSTALDSTNSSYCLTDENDKILIAVNQSGTLLDVITFDFNNKRSGINYLY